MKHILLSALLLASFMSTAQKSADPLPTFAAERMAGLQKKKMLEQRSLVSNIAFRSVGPTVMSGRVVDIEVSPSDPTNFFVAYASGGLWFTDNNGTTFRPLFDQEYSMTIGDFEVDWSNEKNPEIWIGTGEANSSRSSYSGTGIYHSKNFGKSWEHLGLEESHHIGRVIKCQGFKEPGTLLVASIGHLYSPGKDRGVYKTTDGGKTWKQTLFVDENTGVIDLQQDPNNAMVFYACTWHRERRAWNFVESGKGSGIYKSTDAGETWTLISGPKSGFPQGEGIGRIGISVFSGTEGNPHTTSPILYAVVDNQTPSPDTSKPGEEKGLQPDDFKKMSREAFLKIEKAKLEKFLDDNNFPAKYSADYITRKVRNNELKPEALSDFLYDANRDLFSTPITGAEIYRSDDAGATWRKMNEKDIDNFFFTYGYYFGKIWVSPWDANEIFIAGVSLKRSVDGGKTWKSIDGENQHGDHHALWISPKRRGHLINGNDGGVNISWDNGASWFKANTPAVGQFYSVNVDWAKPYNVYGGLQDNGVWMGPSNYEAGLGWYGTGKYPYEFILGGDGMQVQVDPRDNNTVYTGYQFGNYFRLNKSENSSKAIKPAHELGEKPLRFSWQAPIWLSVHNNDIVYFGSNKLHRSLNKGDDWKTVSGDLTRGPRTSDVPFGTLSTIHESPMRFGLLYTGSDDGYIHLSRDGGNNWIRISDALPQMLRVNRVIASAHKESRVYAALSGFQWDHFAPYLYVSEDFGATWTKIGTDLPMEPVNVIREDPENPDLLFIGTDNGLYMSLDRGKTCMRMTGGLPAVAVHDLVIHPRDHELVVGTHGRSIWVADIKNVQQLRDTVLAKTLFVFQPEAVNIGPTWKQVDGDWQQIREVSAEIGYFSKKAAGVTIRLKNAKGETLKEMPDMAEAGVNMARLDLRLNKDPDMKKAFPAEGEYTVEISDAQGTTTSAGIQLKRKQR
ncbi:MAG: glycosyl hydrolase family protein [Bacteroidetes bacterium]|nr:MAG: glycosyl hydrolase family protein [Bacteroidota bacterium]